jgi:16S rRNA (guanine1516-N2)-methyltransferase
VVAAGPEHEAAARDLAQRLGARVVPAAAWAVAPGPPVVIWLDERGIALRGPPAGASPRRPPRPPSGRRGGREGLVRALGGPVARTRVIDATAGWGGDAGVLAAAGATVTMLERSAVVAAMLADALARWRTEGSDAAGRMTLVHGDARVLLEGGGLHAEVVYLDPFYAGREGATTTAADLRWLRTAARWDGAATPDAATAAASEAATLLAARRAASRRVVVKRPLAARPLAGVAPSGSLRGRTTRFDLYAPLQGPAPPTADEGAS